METFEKKDDSAKVLNETLTYLYQECVQKGANNPLVQAKVSQAVEELKGAVSQIENKVKQSHVHLEAKAHEKSERIRQQRKRGHLMVEHEKHAQLRSLYSTFYQWVQTITSDDYRSNQANQPMRNRSNPNQHQHQVNNPFIYTNRMNQMNQMNQMNYNHNRIGGRNVSSMQQVQPPPRQATRIRRPTNIPALRNKQFKSPP